MLLVALELREGGSPPNDSHQILYTDEKDDEHIDIELVLLRLYRVTQKKVLSFDKSSNNSISNFLLKYFQILNSNL